MAQDVRLIANVGFLKGYGGNGVIYAGKTVGGTYMFVLKQLEGNVESFNYYPKSRIMAGFQSGEVILASDLNVQLFTDTKTPDFATDSAEEFKEIPSVTNGDELPRLFNLQTEYSLKGEGVTTADVDALRVSPTGGGTPAGALTPTTGGTTPAASTGGLSGFIPTDFSTLVSNPLKFIQDNMLFVAAVLGVIYFVRKKKKKPLWII